MHRKITRIICFFSIILLFGLLITTGCFEPESTESSKNIVETLNEYGGFSLLLDAINITGYKNTLANNSSSITFFAPTNIAFNKLSQGYLTTLFKKDTDTLADIISYHILLNPVQSNSFTTGQRLETLQGKYVDIVVNETIMIEGATITTADIMCNNGIIHILDTVLYPQKNIIETLDNYTVLSTFSSLLRTADLVDILDNEALCYTVFVPKDEAFSEMNTTYFQTLISDKSNVSSLLSNHIVKNTYYSDDLDDDLQLKTLDNNTLTITLTNDRINVDNVSIFKSDIVCSNGVIHIVNDVLTDSNE